MLAELSWSVRCKLRTGLMCFRKYETSNICILSQTLSYLLLNFGGACMKLYIAFEIAFTSMGNRSNVGNTCPHLVLNLSSCPLPKYVNITIYTHKDRYSKVKHNLWMFYCYETFFA